MNLSRQHQPSTSARSMPRAWLLSLGLLGAGFGMVEPAAAQQAASCDLDCPLGTTCELAPLACPAIACAEDSPDCPVCDTSGATPYCAPAACTADSDCGASMKCAALTAFDCGGEAVPDIAPADGEGQAAPNTRPETPACEESTVRQCTPRWQLPCMVDSDCGAGFRCEEREACSVPGYDPSSGAAPSREVTCTPTGTFACVVVETACSTNADCAADFDCVDNPNGTCSASSNGQTECTTPGPARLCAPRAVASPGTSGDVAVATSADDAPEFGNAEDADGVQASASEGGCSLITTSPASPLAFISTLGLGLAFITRRRRSR